MEESIENGEPRALAWLDARKEALAGIKPYLRLAKPRITLLIAISTAVGYCYGSQSIFSWFGFLNAILGASLMAGGAATLNQWCERGMDAKMNRTKTRPIPSGLVPSNRAFAFGLVISVLGLLELWAFNNPLAAGLGLLTSLGYLFAYTPLKQKHPVCTTIGAVPGAMPALIGFGAARSHLTLEAWVLFGILFLSYL